MREHEIDFKNINLELVENCPCNTKDEILRSEGKWIRELKPSLNERIAGRTMQEYYFDNRDTELEYRKKYYLDNRDKIREIREKYHQQNRDRDLERMKTYRLENKEQIATRLKRIVKCPKCGLEISLGNLAHHKKTKKCLKNSNVQQPAVPE